MTIKRAEDLPAAFQSAFRRSTTTTTTTISGGFRCARVFLFLLFLAFSFFVFQKNKD